MKRRWHYLEENHRSETIHSCIWYDCETHPVLLDDGTTRHDLVFGWAAYRRRVRGGFWGDPEWFRFDDWVELWAWVVMKLRTRCVLYIWAHNQAFDLLASHAFEGLAMFGGKMEDAIIDAPPIVIKYSFASAKITLVDTLNIWRMSLAEMGKHTGLEKLTMPKEWTGAAEDDIYCRRDVEIIMRAVCDWSDFLRANDLGKFCLTIAAQSMQTFRHRYLRDLILIDADEQALKIARACYHGGRVECFYIGRLKGPLHLLDISSLYPSVMAKERFPLRLRGVSYGLSPIELRHLLTEFCICAHVRLKTDEPFAAVVERGKLIFPVGEFDACLSSPELEYALDHAELVEIKAAAVYETGRPFGGFVHDLYRRKLESTHKGETVKAAHWKLLLNSFSGKWGQSGIKWKTIGRAGSQRIRFALEVDADTREIIKYRTFQGLVQMRETTPESANSHPAIAAHITAHGRMRLWALIRQIPAEYRFYCDTDSILVSPQGLEQIKETVGDEVLGILRKVGEYGDGFIHGCKDYVLDARRICKGVRDQAIECDPNTYRQDKWIGFRGALRNGWLDGPRTTSVIKHLRRAYDKGVVSANGLVFPLHRPKPLGGVGGV